MQCYQFLWKSKSMAVNTISQIDYRYPPTFNLDFIVTLVHHFLQKTGPWSSCYNKRNRGEAEFHRKNG